MRRISFIITLSTVLLRKLYAILSFNHRSVHLNLLSTGDCQPPDSGYDDLPTADEEETLPTIYFACGKSSADGEHYTVSK